MKTPTTADLRAQLRVDIGAAQSYLDELENMAGSMMDLVAQDLALPVAPEYGSIIQGYLMLILREIHNASHQIALTEEH